MGVLLTWSSIDQHTTYATYPVRPGWRAELHSKALERRQSKQAGDVGERYGPLASKELLVKRAVYLCESKGCKRVALACPFLQAGNIFEKIIRIAQAVLSVIALVISGSLKNQNDNQTINDVSPPPPPPPFPCFLGEHELSAKRPPTQDPAMHYLLVAGIIAALFAAAGIFAPDSFAAVGDTVVTIFTIAPGILAAVEANAFFDDSLDSSDLNDLAFSSSTLRVNDQCDRNDDWEKFCDRMATIGALYIAAGLLTLGLSIFLGIRASKGASA